VHPPTQGVGQRGVVEQGARVLLPQPAECHQPEPARAAAQQLPCADLEDLVRLQGAPKRLQFMQGGWPFGAAAGEIRRIDRSGRGAAHHGKRVALRGPALRLQNLAHAAEHTSLIGRARPAAQQHQRRVLRRRVVGGGRVVRHGGVQNTTLPPHNHAGKGLSHEAVHPVVKLSAQLPIEPQLVQMGDGLAHGEGIWCTSSGRLNSTGSRSAAVCGVAQACITSARRSR
jgi:hypothetical protein